MALKKWYEVMAANDCLEDHVTWNQMIEYVKHSACTDFTIHSTCTSTGQAFRFTQAGTISKSYGGANTGDDRQWIVNDTDTYPYIEGLGGSHLKFYTGNDIYFYDNAVEEFRFYDNSVDIKGDRAIYINDDETYIGHGAGDNIGAGTNNTLVGHDAGQANNFSNAVLLGYETGKNNTQSNIVAIGYQALDNNTGAENVAVGYAAMDAACSGGYNTGLGTYVLTTNTTGGYNTAVGHNALELNTTGDYNTALGYRAGSSNNHTRCVYLGFAAGKDNTADNRLFINNTDSAYPLIYGEFDNDVVKFGDSSALFFFKFSHDANDAIVETEAANRSIYLKPQGTGLVKFGTYAGKGAEAFAGFITMEDDGGTARKVMICA